MERKIEFRLRNESERFELYRLRDRDRRDSSKTERRGTKFSSEQATD